MSRINLLIIALIFIGVVGYLIVSGLKETTVYYYTVAEVLNGHYNKDASGIRISGIVVKNSVVKGNDDLTLDFKVGNASEKQAIQVHYRGVIPDNFKEGMPVVVEGQFLPDKKEFNATTILLKCPSKYEKQVKE